MRPRSYPPVSGFSSSLYLPFPHNKTIQSVCHWGVTKSVRREKALPVSITQNPGGFGESHFPTAKKVEKSSTGAPECRFEWGHFVQEWKLCILCYFNRLCLFSLREIVWEKIGLSSFYLISKHLYTFPKINLLSQVMSSCFTIILVCIIPPQLTTKYRIRVGKQNICFFGEWGIYHYLFTLPDITWTF